MTWKTSTAMIIMLMLSVIVSAEPPTQNNNGQYVVGGTVYTKIAGSKNTYRAQGSGGSYSLYYPDKGTVYNMQGNIPISKMDVQTGTTTSSTPGQHEWVLMFNEYYAADKEYGTPKEPTTAEKEAEKAKQEQPKSKQEKPTLESTTIVTYTDKDGKTQTLLVGNSYKDREGIGYQNGNGDNVARITIDGTYQVWNPTSKTWDSSTQGAYQRAIQTSIKEQLIASGMSAGDAEKQAEKQAARAIENSNNVANSEGYNNFCQNQWRCIGEVFGAYNKWKGYGDSTAYIIGGDYYEYTQWMKSELRKTFCLFAGVQNCLESLICGNMLDLDDGHILAGRGPGGEFVRSGSINAERSHAVEAAGLSRELLRDIFGKNTTVIAGRTVDFTSPTFDPASLGPIKIRRYHFQLSLRNNAEVGKDFRYNIVLKGPTRNVEWFKVNGQGGLNQKLDPGQRVIIDKYFVSATQYDEICAVFEPKLPAQNAATLTVGGGGFMTGHLCSPFEEYEGGPQTGGGGGTGGTGATGDSGSGDSGTGTTEGQGV